MRELTNAFVTNFVEALMVLNIRTRLANYVNKRRIGFAELLTSDGAAEVQPIFPVFAYRVHLLIGFLVLSRHGDLADDRKNRAQNNEP